MKINNLEMCTTNVRHHAQAGALLVDVRERAEVTALAFDMPAVINIPMSELELGWHALPKDRELLVADQSGAKSWQAAQFLQTKGLTNIKTVRGGILLWMQKGYPVVSTRFTVTDEAIDL